jgi:LuxR family maltose regulon positive regulatory protein
MSTPILATKLYIPPPRPKSVLRPRLIERLSEGLRCKLALISAPAGFGKTTLVSEWLASCDRPAAWLSLDEGDNDPARFLAYVVAALQTIAPSIGDGVLGMLQSPQPPPSEAILTALLNAISSIPDHFLFVLDDYHVLDARPVDAALAFLLEHLPPQMHLVIATREDPQLPLARLRVGGQLTELRVADLRFTPAEAAEFLNQIMGLTLAADDVAALETRTEGWIAGLQLAAISLQGHADATGFITSFTGSHHFVMDYLVEEVLHQQPERVQAFLLRTSILDRLCASLCDAVLLDSAASGQATLEHLEHANLFIVPLDSERRWYRYHHLFAELLRQRLRQRAIASAAGDASWDVAELHRRASQWYEDQGLELDAFHHAAAANDVGRAERLVEGKGVPLHFRGAVTPVLAWLQSLPPAVLDAWPSLWTSYGSVLLATGQTSKIEPALQSAEKALQGAEPNEKTRDLIGRIAAIRASVAGNQNDVETMLAQSRCALEYLSPNNLGFQTSTAWKLAFAYHMQGNRAAARRAYADVVSIGQASGITIYTSLATIGLGMLQEWDNQLHPAAQTYRRVLEMVREAPLAAGASEAHVGLARVLYEWNDLDAAEQHAQQGLQLGQQVQNSDRFISCEVLLARVQLARGDAAVAAALLAEASQSVRQRNAVYRIPEVVAAQVQTLLHQGNLEAAAQLAQAHELPLSQAQVHLAQGNPAVALAVLEPWLQEVDAKDWADERLKALVLQALALQAQGDTDEAEHVLGDALALAESGGFVRTFVDEGLPMERLLSATAAHGYVPDYIEKLLAAFGTGALARSETPAPRRSVAAPVASAQPLIEPLSHREVEVLQLIAQGCSNQEISERLFLALDTVKGHNRRIFDKLQVQRRTEAVARARELGLL